MSRVDEAIERLKKQARQHSNDPERLYSIATLLDVMGAEDEAERVRETARRIEEKMEATA